MTLTKTQFVDHEWEYHTFKFTYCKGLDGQFRCQQNLFWLFVVQGVVFPREGIRDMVESPWFVVELEVVIGQFGYPPSLPHVELLWFSEEAKVRE